MKLLDRYIAKTILSSIALVTFLLAGLQIFILMVNQLDDIGKGEYGLMQSFVYVLLQMPYQVYLFFPMATLLGTLIGLGGLANHRELIVMRAAGMSIAQITLAVFKAALLLIVVVTATGETVIPKLSMYANNYKTQALTEGQLTRTAEGVWLRYRNDFITIATILPDYSLLDVYQFRFDKQYRMQLARRIERIRYENGRWQAYHVTETRILADKIESQQLPSMLWDVTLKPSIIVVSSREPDEMTLDALGKYMSILKRSHQATVSYELVYWQRIIQPFSTVVMMLLAIPFIFGPLRSSTMGSKLLVGATAGFGFHLINRFFGPLSQFYQWPPLLAALGPTLVFALLGIYLIRRMK